MDIFSNVQQNVEELPSLRDVVFVPVERQHFSIILVNGFILLVILLGILLYLWTAVTKPLFQANFQWILLGVLLLFMLWASYAFKAFGFKAYAFREKDITYRTGWLWRSTTTVPFNRVQHCEVSQGVLDRYFGLGKLKIYTAGGSSSDVSIPGLFVEQATDLKDFIVEKIKEDE
jgi:membrane protein YdbS with pleckstrin-like domain